MRTGAGGGGGGVLLLTSGEMRPREAAQICCYKSVSGDLTVSSLL